jgi:hypothetical protein
VNREQAERALVNAHKAGDVESAKKIASAIKEMSAAPAAATPDQIELANPINRLATGVIDPGVGIAQGAAHAIASPVGEALKQEPGMSNLPFVGGMIGLANNLPAAVSKVADAGKAAFDKKYEDARKAVGNTGVDWMRAAGNVAIGAPISLALGPAGAAENIASAVATGAAFPVDAGQGYAKEKFKQAAISGVTAGALEGLKALATAGADKFVKTLRANKINPTPGRTLGGLAGSVEDRATSIPIVGDAITSARKSSLDELNRAAYKYALDPIGESVDDVPVGREAIKAIGDKISAGYEEVLPLVRFKADPELAGTLSNIAKAAGRLPKNEQDVYRTTMTQVVLPQLRNGREVNGEAWKTVDIYLGQRVANLLSGGPYERDLASLFRDVQQSLRDGLARSNPKMADRISSLNEGWKAFRIISDAGSGARAAEGFTPNALSTAVKRASGGVANLRYSRGQAFMQDLSDAASMRLPSAYPDSGTAGRSLLAQGAGLMTSPLAIPYLPGIRGLSSSLAANRLGNIPAVSPVLRGIGATSPVSGAMTPTLQSLLMKKRPEPESD